MAHLPTNFMGLRQTPLPRARVVILPIPYEGTVCYGHGTSLAPAAILAASTQLERFDEELRQPVGKAAIHTLPFLQPGQRSAKAMARLIRQTALPHVSQGRLVIGLGGEHGVAIGLFAACRQVYGKGFSILQLDAHTDLRHRYQGSRFSHACTMRRAHDMGIPFVQVGVRSLSRGEWRFVEKQGLSHNIHWASHIAREEKRGEQGWMAAVVAALAPQVYVTLDVDCLDPGQMAATGTPEPGGLDYHEVTALLRRVGEARHIIGADITELAPIPHHTAWDFSAARLVQKMAVYFTQT